MLNQFRKVARPSQLTSYIRKYQKDGYRISSAIDPLGLWKPPGEAKEFDPEHWGLSEHESLHEYRPDPYLTKQIENCATVTELAEYLRRTYADKVTVEFGHITDE